jgi:hypothetical protein
MRHTRIALLALVLGSASLGTLAPAAGAAAAATSSQSLAFAVQPAKTIVNHVITGVDVNPAGTPLTVDVLNGDGTIDMSSSAPVTIALAANPSGGVLSGTTTVNAVNGVATFSTLTIDKAGIGYQLLATSPGITPAASRPFDEVDAGTRCTGTGTCSTSASTQTSTLNVNVPGGATTLLSVSFDVGTPLVCPGYTAQDANWFSFLSSTTANGKLVTYQVRPSTGATEIVGATQFCLGAPYAFESRAGGLAGPGVLPDGSSGFIALLPNCHTGSRGPCIVSRSTTPDKSSPTGFDVVLAISFPAGLPGDPWGRA